MNLNEERPNFSQEELLQIQKRSERERDKDLIMLLEHRGYTVFAQQLAKDSENTQMIAILEARGLKVIDPNNLAEEDINSIKNLLKEENNVKSNNTDNTDDNKLEL